MAGGDGRLHAQRQGGPGLAGPGRSGQEARCRSHRGRRHGASESAAAMLLAFGDRDFVYSTVTRRHFVVAEEGEAGRPFVVLANSVGNLALVRSRTGEGSGMRCLYLCGGCG